MLYHAIVATFGALALSHLLPPLTSVVSPWGPLPILAAEPFSAGTIALMALLGGGSALSSYAQSRQQRQMHDQNLALSDEQAKMLDARQRDLALLDYLMGISNIGMQESALNPFRHQAAQGDLLSRLDRLENASFTPVNITPAAAYAQYKPQVTGGYSYEKSPELRQYAASLKENVAAGHGAPTMTNPRNFGKTGAVNLIGGQDPATAAAASGGAGVPFNEKDLVEAFVSMLATRDQRRPLNPRLAVPRTARYRESPNYDPETGTIL